MPWHLDSDHPDCSGWAVVKDDSGEVVGCHKTKKDALAHLAALNANVDALDVAPTVVVVGKRKPQGIVERRYAPLSDVEVRQDGASVLFKGRPAVFNVVTDLFFFREKLAPGAFKKTIKDGADVRFLYNHEPDSVMARTTNGTLRLKEDRDGLVAEADLDTKDWDTQRIVPKLERGDISQMSFAFLPVDEDWDEEPEDGGLPIRTLREVKLFDVSPVTFPAYEATDAELVSVRSMLEKSTHSALLDRADTQDDEVSPATSDEEAEQGDDGTKAEEPGEDAGREEHSPSTEQALTEEASEDANADEEREEDAEKRERLQRLKGKSTALSADFAELQRKVQET